MDKIREAKAQRVKLQADIDAMLWLTDGSARDLADDDRAAADIMLTDAEALDATIGRMEADEDRFKKAMEAKARLSTETARRTPTVEPSRQADAVDRIVPATARRHSGLKAFKGPNAELEAYSFGIWYAACLGHPWALKRARDLAVSVQRTTHVEGTNTLGGFLVPDQFETTLVDLREQYGAFRAHARIVPMTSDFISYLRRTGGPTAYLVGEAVAITESNKTWDRLTMTAKKVGVLMKYSSELSEDGIINIADDLAREIAYAFAYFEDMCGFRANGEATYGGIVGLGPAITNVNGVDEGGGVIVGTGDTPAEITMADFSRVIAILPAYADGADAAWYCNRTVWAHMQRLEAALGGNTGTDIIDGYRVQKFLGYPVHFVQVMNVGSAVSQVLAFLGDLALAADMGVRRGTSLAIDTTGTDFEEDVMSIKGTERIDVNVHDVGTATVAGPVVALIGKAE